MKKLRCIFSAENRAFTEGRDYETDASQRFITGNDGESDEPWQLDKLEVKIKYGVIARFKEVA